VKRLLTAPAFRTLVFCMLFLFLNWPVLTVFEEKQTGSVWFYLFGVWGVIILLQLLIAAGHDTEKATKKLSEQDGN